MKRLTCVYMYLIPADAELLCIRVCIFQGHFIRPRLQLIFCFDFFRLSESSSSDGSCRSLWVGNVNPEIVSERHLLQLFSRCGHVDNVRILPKRFCAFVNFEKAESAAIALEKLQVHVTLKFHLCDNLSFEHFSAFCILFFCFSFSSEGVFAVQCIKEE